MFRILDFGPIMCTVHKILLENMNLCEEYS